MKSMPTTSGPVSATQSRAAFTLTELLVVIAIMVLLMAILVPALGKAREMAKMAVCKTNVHTLTQMMTRYSTDKRGQLPLGYNGGGNPPSGAKQFNYTMGIGYEAAGVEERAYGPFGSLYLNDLLAAPETYYCPMMKNPMFQFNSVSNPWFGRELDEPASTGWKRGGYGTRPIAIWSGSSLRTELPRIANMAGGTATVSDIASTPYYADHHLPKIHVGHVDGSVSTVRSDRDFDQAWHDLHPTDYAQPGTNEVMLDTSVHPNKGIWTVMDQ